MNTTKSIALVRKCKGILIMIDRVNQKLESQNRRLANCDKGLLYVFSTRPILEILIEKNIKVLARLTLYYTRTLRQLTDEALLECFEEAA